MRAITLRLSNSPTASCALSRPKGGKQMEYWTVVIKFAVALVTLAAALTGLIAAIKKYQTAKKQKLIADDEHANIFVSQFNLSEVSSAVSGYVEPHCSPSDPTNRDEEQHLADMREPIFAYLDRTIEKQQSSHHIILADTGMGKTSFCLNYFVRLKQRNKKYEPCLISLARGNALDALKAIKNKQNKILIADAFDEDPHSIGEGRNRLNDILEASADFRVVIVTCRSQYFTSDDTIPRETPLPIIAPRKLGQSQSYGLMRSYISPFDEREIDRYIEKHFPLWQPWKLANRRRAQNLAKEIPDLAYRPMLLERLPEIVRDKSSSSEVYDLYNDLVQGWITRESRRINANDLRRVSEELALYIYSRMPDNRGRLSMGEISYVATTQLGENPEWQHLSSRSLLNRDSNGLFKFAHKSILEFLIVKMAVEGDGRALSVPWTPFMKDLFVSWGHSNHGQVHPNRAREILESTDGRANIAPLYDTWAADAAAGLPDFKRVAERRVSHTGKRLAPSTWRSASIEAVRNTKMDALQIRDREYNLEWLLTSPDFDQEYSSQDTLIHTLKIANSGTFRLPSYDQFICLLEGIHSTDRKILRDGDLFLLSDRPSERQHLIVKVGTKPPRSGSIQLVDRERKIAGTDFVVSAYITGIHISPSFAHDIMVKRLWLLS